MSEGPAADSYQAELAHEQEFVDRAYQVLDHDRRHYRAAQREVEAQGAWGTPQARTERDVMASHYGDQAVRLEQIEDRLVFGRIDPADKPPVYIGRAGLRGEDQERLLVDWRAPVALPFYQATPSNPQGIVRRRHIGSHLRQVRSIEDEPLDVTAPSARDLQFQGEGALMSALSRARDGRMGDIVSTIQAEQDAIIRASDRGILLVQGGPGTGKTAVALHRAAYLLYTHRERLEKTGVLIVGPSRVFLRYIEQVLPSLGETGVVAVTMGELLPRISATATDLPEVAAAKGVLEWLPTLRAAVKSLQRLPERDLEFTFSGKKAKLSVGEVREVQSRARRSGKPHNEAREAFALDLVESLVAKLAGTNPDHETKQWWREEVRGSRDARREINLCWMPTRAVDLLRRLYARPELLAQVGTFLSEEQRQLVARPADAPWTPADIPLLDELEELLGERLANQSAESSAQALRAEVARAQQAIESQELGGGLVSAELLAARARGETNWAPLTERARADRSWAYGHILVDEAQDLSPMAWHSLLRRCPSGSFTAVGDLDQRRGWQRPNSWYEALGPAARALRDEKSLTISYRTPASIMEMAQLVMQDLGEPVKYPTVSARDVPGALAATPAEPGAELWATVQRVVAEESARLEGEVGAEQGRIGVLLGMEFAREVGADLEGTRALDQRISYLSVSAAKGLEFDTTVLVEPAEILRDGPGDLFVAMTRSTQRLHAVYSEPLPPAWVGALPSETG